MLSIKIELDEWQRKAFERKRKPALLAIEIEDDNVLVSGPSCVVKKIMDTSLLDYVEVDGFMKTLVYDPVPNRAKQVVNAMTKYVRNLKSKSKGRG